MKKILIIVTICSLALAAAFYFLMKRERTDRVQAENNLSANTKVYVDNLGKSVTESQELRLSVHKFKQIVKQDSIYMNDFEKKLARANEVIKSQDKKIRKVESVNSILLQSSGSDHVFYQVNDTCKLAAISPIRTKYFDASFQIASDSVIVMDHLYHSGVDIIISRKRGLDDDESKRFLLCRLLFPQWVYSSSVVAEDPNAKITGNVLIRFKK